MDREGESRAEQSRAEQRGIRCTAADRDGGPYGNDAVLGACSFNAPITEARTESGERLKKKVRMQTLVGMN